MAPRPTPSIRQRRFGAELRRLREAAGMSAPRAAELLGTDRTTISNVESGRFGISEPRLRRLASIYECDNASLVDALAAMTGGRTRGWWDEYRGKIPPDFLDVSELEHHASSLRTLQMAHIPGLFQTEEHARALFEIHEAALRFQIGGRQTAKAQLNWLLAESERPNVTLLVIPLATEGFPMAGDTMMYVSASDSHLDTVEVDSPTGAVFFDSPTKLANFRRRLDLVEQVALNPMESRDRILEIVGEL
ncbi:helix-turn-helix domain-containing protein [Streptomyces sp. enrichment culture]|uniref:helix-turn-helix domain-containing protein n=1 Tax=Streptomyces sp. enrichment culture TaxID=1795815 RepID=UPI003F57BE7A